MKDHKTPFLKKQSPFTTHEESFRMLNVLPTLHKSEDTKNLKRFIHRMDDLKETINRLNFMMSEIHDIVKTRFQ